MIGQYAVSLSGRDKGRTFIILGVPEENFVLLADGELRRIAKPKRKKLKHIRLLSVRDGVIPETDRKLYTRIKEISQS